MTDPAAPNSETSISATSIPAGWHPDPAGSARSRWWDGTQWTDNYTQPTTSSVLAFDATSTVTVYTRWVWVIVGLLGLSVISLATFNYGDYMATILSEPQNPLALYTPGYLFLMAVSFIAFWGAVIFAFLDHRELTRSGVPKPFHWAFTFISVVVYLIGRAVVLKRRVGAGSATLWIAIGYVIISTIVTIVWIAGALDVVTQYSRLN